MSENRKACLATFERTGLEPVLVTPDNLSEWVVPDHPIHPAFQYLSATQRGDYLKAYMMYHHGGGYADIKRQLESWLPTVDKVLKSGILIGAGYREVRGGTPWLHNHMVNGQTYIIDRPAPYRVTKLVSNIMRGSYWYMIGNGALYFKRHSLYCKIWLNAVEYRLDLLYDSLKANPARHPRDSAREGTGYPVPWSFLHGDINGPLSLAFFWSLSRDLPRPDFINYM